MALVETTMPADQPITSEEWRDIPDFPRYQASSLGQIKSFCGIQSRILSPNIGSRGYCKVRITHKSGRIVSQNVNILVLAAFHGPKPFLKAVCRHKDGNKLNNREDNLLWGTYQDNLHDAVGHGTRVKVMFPKQVDQVIAMDAAGILRSEIAEHFGVTRPQITKVLLRHNKPSSRPYKPPQILSDAQRLQGAMLKSKGTRNQDIAAILGVSISTVKRHLPKLPR